MLLGEIKGQKSRKNLSSRHKRSESKESRISIDDDSRRTNDYVETSIGETKNTSKEDEKLAEKEEKETVEIVKAIEPISAPTFEALAVDSNTERKFLENISFNQPDHISEVELKSTIFNSYKTIETLQQDLM